MSNLLDGLNEPQKQAVLHGLGPMIVLAGPGSGKTATVTRRIARLIREKEVDPSRILGVTFTNKAATEMRERVEKLLGRKAYGLWLCTFHAAAARILRKVVGQFPFGRTSTFEIIDQSTQTKEMKAVIQHDLKLDEKEYKAPSFLSALQEAKAHGILPTDYEYRGQLAPLYRKAAAFYEARLRVLNAFDFGDLLLYVTQALDQDKDLREEWSRTFQYILVDEYQDTCPVQLLFLDLLTSTHKNISVVGDDAQCLVEGTSVELSDGSMAPIETIKPGQTVLTNAGQGNWRSAAVLATSRKWFESDVIKLTLASGTVITSTPEHTHFAGYRLGVTPQYFFTYLMFKRGMGWRIGTTQVYSSTSQAKPIIGFRTRAPSEGADALWVVGVHANENDARLDEYILSLTYQIPTLPFRPRAGGSVNGLVHDAKYISAVFAAFDTEANARRLLAAKGLLAAFPHHRPRTSNSNRRNVTLTLCAEWRGDSPMHRISIGGNDVEGKAALTALGMSVRKAKSKDGSGWRFETVYKSFAELEQFVVKLRAAFPDLNVFYQARLGVVRPGHHNDSLPFTPALAVLPGMSVFTRHGEYDVVVSVERVPYAGWVYDMNVEGTHNFVANGMLTHNCIFGFTFANLHTILDFARDYPGAKEVRLEQNYRSTPEIVEASNLLIENNRVRYDKTCFTANASGPGITVVVHDGEKQESWWAAAECMKHHRAGVPWGEMFVLYRTNSQSRVLEEAFVGKGIPYNVKGAFKFYDREEIQDLLGYLKVLSNPANRIAWERIANKPTRGLGASTVQAIVEYAQEHRLTFREALNDSHYLFKGVTQKKVAAFTAQMQRLEIFAEGAKVSSLLQTIIDGIDFKAWLLGKGDTTSAAADRWQNVLELVRAVEMYENDTPPDETSLLGFLERVALVTQEDEAAARDKDKVLLTTLHSCKGLEAQVVIITGVEQGLIPHFNAMHDPAQSEEERRLFYVGMTRAKRFLYLSRARSRWLHGKPMDCRPSQFLNEIS